MDSLEPSIRQLCDTLLPQLPGEHREEARALLAHRILPAQLRGLPAHPAPRRLTELVSQQILQEVARVPAGERLRVLHGLALGAQIQLLAADSLSLAVARYLLDHPDALSNAKAWVNAEVQAFLLLPPGGMQARAAEMLAALDSACRQAQEEFPAVWGGLQHHWAHSRLDLESAASGNYAHAAGSLLDFLRSVGHATGGSKPRSDSFPPEAL
ncbi:MAG TPA: hypothetical protein VFL86_14825 [Burkholderiaceae bacterium]|nr:hypothetical protein [Burkholderiaceae bacterium]